MDIIILGNPDQHESQLIMSLIFFFLMFPIPLFSFSGQESVEEELKISGALAPIEQPDKWELQTSLWQQAECSSVP